MIHDGSMLGLWIVRTSKEALLARVQDELYLLAFTSALRVGNFLRSLGDGHEGEPFYVCLANVARVTREARESGARGFIVDYDPARAGFASAHALPTADAGARELR